jgi:hypothetical protein
VRCAIPFVVLVACGRTPPASVDASADVDAAIDASPDASPDASTACASSAGAPGSCVDVAACAGLGDHVSEPGHCPGPQAIQCCVKTPNVADNPPVPAGYRLMMQADVTPAMTTWAVDILHDPITYPMFATTTMTFGALTVLARVEWHPPDFQNSAIHRGVTLYQPI